MSSIKSVVARLRTFERVLGSAKSRRPAGQTAFELDAPNLDARYAHAHEEDLDASRDTLLRSLPQKGAIRFGDLWPIVLEQHHVRLADVKAALLNLADAKSVRWERSKGSKQRAPHDDDTVAVADAGTGA